MRVLICGINYSPEPAGIAPFNVGMAEWLAQNGHDVEVVTTFPYYPSWKKRAEDHGKLYEEVVINGVRVHRCWHYVPESVTSVRRIIHELSFAIMGSIRLLMLRRPDVMVVVSPPLILGPAAGLLCGVLGCGFIFHVQDLQPDAAVGLGMLKNPTFIRLLYAVERVGYAAASRVGGISHGMMDAFARKSVPQQKRLFFPNWKSETPREALPPGTAASFRRALGIADDAFLAVYSGNIGKKQGLGVCVEAWKAIERRGDTCGPRPIILIIAGEGAAKADLEVKVKDAGLATIVLAPLLPEDDYLRMLAAANVGVITQERGTGQYFFPSKLLSFLSNCLPIVAVADADSELSKATSEGQFGVVVPPDDPEEFASVIIHLANSPSKLVEARRNTVWVNKFSKQKILGDLESELKKICDTDVKIL